MDDAVNKIFRPPLSTLPTPPTNFQLSHVLHMGAYAQEKNTQGIFFGKNRQTQKKIGKGSRNPYLSASYKHAKNKIKNFLNTGLIKLYGNFENKTCNSVLT